MKFAQRCFLFAFVFLAGAAVAHAQGIVTGVVTDSSGSQPLNGARVTIVGTSIATQTGDNGRFTLRNVPAGVQQVRIQRIGFSPSVRTVTVRDGETASIAASLVAQATQLSAVVAVGYGTQLRRDLTGAVSTVTTEALDKAPVTSVDQMLQGTSAGVQVTTSSAEPGGAISIRIRGTSSITGNAEPLYVIDGFPIENDIEGSSVGNGGRDRTTPPNPLSSLNPSDIESISVLKDASATAIYGSRGANGVIIVTTKQGRGATPTFSLDWYAGNLKVAKTYDLLSASQYMDYSNEFGQNSSTPFTPFPDSLRAAILASGVNTDWQNAIFKTGMVRNIQAGVRGSTNNSMPTRYALSLNQFAEQGIVLGSGLSRLSGRVNLDQMLGSRFEVGGSLTGAQVRTKSTPTSGQQNGNVGAVSAAIQYPNILPIKHADGTYSNLFADLNAISSGLGATAVVENPVALASEVTDSLSDTRVLGNIFGQAELLKNLKLKVTLGTDYADRWRNTYYPRTTIRGAQVNGQAIRAAATTTSYLNENTLNYSRQFGSQSLDLLGGYSLQKSSLDGSNISNSNFVNDITGYFSIGAGTQTGGPGVSSRHSAQTLASWISRVNYSLLDRYLVTLTERKDGSSRFAANKKWGSFPSAAFAWRASSEGFLKRFSALNDLKFRVSTGLVGNPSIRPYQSLASLTNTTYSFGGTPVSGYYVNVVGNPNLTWETTRQYDQGVDIGLWNRFNITMDSYRKRTTDLLLQVSLPFETGFESALANRGSIENRGIELALDADMKKTGAIRWHTNLNYSRNRNKVLSLGEGVNSIFADIITTDYNLPGTLIQVGQPLGMFYGFKSAGVIRDSAAAAAITWKNFNNSAFKPGDMKVLDLDGDGVITLADRTVIGDPTPDFTYGMTNTFTVHGFELTGLLQGQHGGKVLNVNRIRTESGPRSNISVDRWLNRWTPTNMDAKYPRIGENPNQVGTNNFTDNLLEDASYLRLRTITISSALPSEFTSHLGMSNARYYITGTNLWTKSHYSGFDPDVSAQSVGNVNRGIDIGAYPLAKSVTTGVTLSF